MEYAPHIIALLVLGTGVYLALSTRHSVPKLKLKSFRRSKLFTPQVQPRKRPQTTEPDPEITRRIQETRDAAQAKYLDNIATEAQTTRNKDDRNYRNYRGWRGGRHHELEPTPEYKDVPKAPDCTSCNDTKFIIRGYDGRKIRCPSCR